MLCGVSGTSLTSARFTLRISLDLKSAADLCLRVRAIQDQQRVPTLYPTVAHSALACQPRLCVVSRVREKDVAKKLSRRRESSQVNNQDVTTVGDGKRASR